jgi:hypothetical protein
MKKKNKHDLPRAEYISTFLFGAAQTLQVTAGTRSPN